MASEPPIVFDDDNPEWTKADFARAKPAAEVLPPEVLAAFAKPRGRPKLANAKVAVKLRIDPDVLGAYKATGARWQTRMNNDLREAISGKFVAKKGATSARRTAGK